MTKIPSDPPRLDPPRLDLGLGDLAVSYDLVLCDVWGVIHNGIAHHSAAVDALRRYRRGGGTVILVTNAPSPRERVQSWLDHLDVPRDAYDGIATSGEVTIAMIVEAGCPPLFNIGPEGEVALYDSAARRGPRAPKLVEIAKAEMAICIGLVDDRAEPAAYDPMLREMRARDLTMVCANPDIVVEVGDTLVYCAGAITERYAAMGGTVMQAGKPFPKIYDMAFAIAATIRGPVPKARILAIGDALHTDIQGARDQEIASLFITTGIHRNAVHPEASHGEAVHGEGLAPAIDAARLTDLLARHGAGPMAALPGLAWRL